MTIPQPSTDRLIYIARILEALQVPTINSKELASKSGYPSDTIRKDISFLDQYTAPSNDNTMKNVQGTKHIGRKGYFVKDLEMAIKRQFGLDTPRPFCIIGLGRLGSAFLNYHGFESDGFELVAGFDASVNRLEVLSASVPLYPAFKMGEVIQRKAIEMALLCVPPEASAKVCSIIVPAGIKAIVNFTPVVLEVPKEVHVRNVHVGDELRILTARLNSVS